MILKEKEMGGIYTFGKIKLISLVDEVGIRIISLLDALNDW